MAGIPVNSPAEPRPTYREADAIIRTRGLTKVFSDQTVVSEATFYVPSGSIFGFIGPSGSGKTTTIRLLTGYYPPTRGEVQVFGKPPASFGQSLRARIGYMPQLFVLYPHLSVWENLNFAASIYGMSLFRRQRLEQALKFVELDEHRTKLARDISGGMQRRLSLAATLVHEPELLFLDEPTAGIDPVLRAKFWERFRALRDEGRTLFITTQYVSESAYCDLVGVISDGRMIAVNTPEKLRTSAFGGEIVDLRLAESISHLLEYQISQLPFVQSLSRRGASSLRLVVDEASTAMPALLDWCREQNLAVEAVEEFQPPFDDVFVELIRRDRESRQVEE